MLTARLFVVGSGTTITLLVLSILGTGNASWTRTLGFSGFIIVFVARGFDLDFLYFVLFLLLVFLMTFLPSSFIAILLFVPSRFVRLLRKKERCI